MGVPTPSGSCRVVESGPEGDFSTRGQVQGRDIGVGWSYSSNPREVWRVGTKGDLTLGQTVTCVEVMSG